MKVKTDKTWGVFLPQTMCRWQCSHSSLGFFMLLIAHVVATGVAPKIGRLRAPYCYVFTGCQHSTASHCDHSRTKPPWDKDRIVWSCALVFGVRRGKEQIVGRRALSLCACVIGLTCGKGEELPAAILRVAGKHNQPKRFTGKWKKGQKNWWFISILFLETSYRLILLCRCFFWRVVFALLCTCKAPLVCHSRSNRCGWILMLFFDTFWTPTISNLTYKLSKHIWAKGTPASNVRRRLFRIGFCQKSNEPRNKRQLRPMVYNDASKSSGSWTDNFRWVWGN